MRNTTPSMKSVEQDNRIHLKGQDRRTIKAELAREPNTARKVRHVLSKGYTVLETYHLLKDLGISTKSGTEIRYQHVRNVAMMRLASDQA